MNNKKATKLRGEWILKEQIIQEQEPTTTMIPKVLADFKSKNKYKLIMHRVRLNYNQKGNLDPGYGLYICGLFAYCVKSN